jgi:hypothetical protein
MRSRQSYVCKVCAAHGRPWQTKGSGTQQPGLFIFSVEDDYLIGEGLSHACFNEAGYDAVGIAVDTAEAIFDRGA